MVAAAASDTDESFILVVNVRSLYPPVCSVPAPFDRLSLLIKYRRTVLVDDRFDWST
jgi:hypothetical protein